MTPESQVQQCIAGSIDGFMTCIILAGGLGTRFVPQKGLLPCRGGTMIESIIARLSTLFDDFILAVNDEEPYRMLRYPLVKDEYPSLGPLGAIYSGLARVQRTSFFCGCDMPFISRPLVRAMRENVDGHDVVIPCYLGNPEPLHAFYGPVCLPYMERQIALGDLRIVSFFPSVRVKFINVEEGDLKKERHMFFNINTEEDYQRALQLMAEEENCDNVQ